MSKKTGIKDKNGRLLNVGDKVHFKGEVYEVVKNVVPFNHFALYKSGYNFNLKEVYTECEKLND